MKKKMKVVFMKYREVYPAQLTFISILAHQYDDSFDDQVGKLQNEIQQDEVESVLMKLLNKQEENTLSMKSDLWITLYLFIYLF
jgi:hypothetical protein